MELRAEQKLITRAHGGDREAFVKLWHASERGLAEYVERRIGEHLRSEVDADDILQETSARAWESIERLSWNGADTFARWLRGIARNVILKNIERARRGDFFLVADAQRRSEPTASRALRRAERFERLRAAVDLLPPDYREAITLVRLEGLQIREAAERMGRSPKAVTHLVSRALKRLKATLGDTESLRLPPRRLNGDRHDGS